MTRPGLFVSFRVVLLLLSAVLTAGCGDERPEGTVRQATTLAEVPEKAIQAAKNALPGVTLQSDPHQGFLRR